ncbi:MAG: cysteine hydrolase [Clostridiales bacterium]|nr:cysteine hydrolase [Clostridiales bacterium]
MNLNEFTAQYYGGLASTVYKEPVPLDKADTALVLIDVQDQVTRSYFEEYLVKLGFDASSLGPVFDEIEEITCGALANIEKILNKCREKGIRPIHCKIQAYLRDAADTGRLHKSAGMLQPPGCRESNFLPEGAPMDGEIVLTKTCSGIHVGTPIDRVLRNLGIANVIVVGFYTDQCVSTSVRDLADLGYRVALVTDAVAAMSRDRHDMALNGIGNIYARSETTAEILERLEKL